MKILISVAWAFNILGVLLGVIVLVGGMGSASGAPQEAVIICLALALAILPYCFARALTEIYNVNK